LSDTTVMNRYCSSTSSIFISEFRMQRLSDSQAKGLMINYRRSIFDEEEVNGK